jgi:hypothetical protein
MKVSTLISKLSELDPDAEVLLLSGSADISSADELRRVEQQDEWRCEVHFRDDGLSKSLHAPASFGKSMEFDEVYDRTIRESVVLLAAYNGNLDYMYVGDSSPENGGIGMNRLAKMIVQEPREMLEDGRLLSRERMLSLLGTDAAKFDELVNQGHIFGIVIDGLPYYPSIFANPRVNAARVQEISHLIQPAPLTCRLDFLLSPWTPLNGSCPLEMLDDERDFERVRRWAQKWAEDWSRTAVRVFAGEHPRAPTDCQPLYVAMAEFDPRRRMWSRARATLHEFGFEHPSPPYPVFDLFTAFLEKQTRGMSDTFPEAAVCIERVASGWRIRSVWPAADERVKREAVVSAGEDIVAVMKAVFRELDSPTGT